MKCSVTMQFHILIYTPKRVNQNDYSIYPDDILHNDYVRVI